MQQIAAQCTSCSLFTRRSLHHEEQYQSSVLCEQLRTSNTPATDAEISHVRHTILPTVSGDISSIDTKIASLHEVIRSMEEERGRLIEVQAKYSNLISLHRTLPLEIWSEIFLYTISTPQDANAFNASGIIWGLSHVCQRWRSVALSLQSFWSTMDLRFPDAAQHEQHVQRLEVVIQRSRQGPLNVTLNNGRLSGQRDPDSNPSILKHMLDIVLAESYRWREFHLTDYVGNLRTAFYASLHHRFPRLESIGLSFAPFEPEHTVVSAFKDCPRLTKLCLGGGTLDIAFPWDQVTELDLSYMDFDGDEEARRICTSLIGQCPSLEILSTPDWYSDDDDDGSAYTPIISNLSKLDTSSVHVLDFLTLPHLREASLNQDATDPLSDMLYSFERLLRRSNCITALTRLSLTSVPLFKATSETHLLSMLTQTHSLTFLDFAVSMQRLDGEMDDEEIVAFVNYLDFIPKDSAVTFLPLLSSLGIRLYDLDDARDLRDCLSVGSFTSMVRARWKGDETIGLARLRTCHLAVAARRMTHNVFRNDGSAVFDVFTEADSLMFAALIEDGMDLSIQITAKSTVNVGGDNVVFAVPR